MWKLGGVPLVCLLPFLELATAHPYEPLPVGRLAVIWLLVTSVSTAAAHLLSKHTPRAIPVAVVIIYVFFHYTQLPPPEPLSAAGLIIGGILASKWDWFIDWVAIALVLTVGVLGAQAFQRPEPQPIARADLQVTAQSHPNVYYVVVDGYGRSDVLASDYGHDITSFVEQLESRGFTIPQSTAAYPVTYLSIASTLNMAYAAGTDDDIYQAAASYAAIQGDNATVELFKSWGYTYLHAPAPGWSGSSCKPNVQCIDGQSVTEAEIALIRRTPLFSIAVSTLLADEYVTKSDPHRILVDYDRPFFILAHLLSPHPPHFQASDCSRRPTGYPYTDFAGSNPDDYVDELVCLNTRLLDAIDQIPPSDVIIVQSDHGPGHGVPFSADAWDPPDLRRRLATFTAIRLPSCEVPDRLSNINTFRLVVGCLSGSTVEVLPERHWVPLPDGRLAPVDL